MLRRRITIYSSFLCVVTISVTSFVFARHIWSEETKKSQENSVNDLIVIKLAEVPAIVEGIAGGFLESTTTNRGKSLLNGWVDWGDGPQILYWVAPSESRYVSGHIFHRGDIAGTGRAFVLIAEEMKDGSHWCLFVKNGEQFKQVDGQVAGC